MFETIAIIGAGHMGSSIAHAAREKGGVQHVRVFDASAEVRARAAQIPLGEVFASAAEAVTGADAVFLCTPVGAMREAAGAIAPHLKPGAIVSDVGGVKKGVIEAAAPLLPAHAFFVPGHPIAGTEYSGPDSGFATIFENRWMILTPLDDPRPEYAAAVEKVRALWLAFGAKVELMEPARHDMVLAVTSHLPHLIAFNIVAMAEDLEKVAESEVVKFSAGGFRDFTRIAASDPTMWRDVFLANREAVLEIVGRFTDDLAVLNKAIRNSDGAALHDLFTRARRMRREVIDAGQDRAAPNFGRDEKE